MPSTCKSTMKVNTVPKIPRKKVESTEEPQVSVKQESKEVVTKKSSPKKKPATKKKLTSPEDAILASAAVDPDLEKAAKPKKVLKTKAATSKTTRARKTTAKKTKTKKA